MIYNVKSEEVPPKAQRDRADKMLTYAFATLLLPASILYTAFVIAQTWKWFVPGIFGLAPISLAQAYGLGILAEYLTYQDDARHSFDLAPEQTMLEQFFTKFIMAEVRISLTFLLALVVKQFV